MWVRRCLVVGLCDTPWVVFTAVLCVCAAFISSDFGVHPVVTLIRGLVTMLDPTEVEVRQRVVCLTTCTSPPHATCCQRPGGMLRADGPNVVVA